MYPQIQELVMVGSAPAIKQGGKVTMDVAATKEVASVQESSASDEPGNDGPELQVVPLRFKIASILLVSAIGFGSSWSSGITGAMKTALKKVCYPITNAINRP